MDVRAVWSTRLGDDTLERAGIYSNTRDRCIWDDCWLRHICTERVEVMKMRERATKGESTTPRRE